MISMSVRLQATDYDHFDTLPYNFKKVSNISVRNQNDFDVSKVASNRL